MTPGDRCDNPIRQTLDAAGIPWRLPRAELAARYGIRRHAAYDWDVIEIKTAPPIVDGLLWPLSARVLPQFSSHLPATQFTALVRVSDDAAANLRFAVERFATRLGPGETNACANSIEVCWACEAARLRLTVWPPAMQQWTFTNPAHDGDPRLKTACLLVIDTGLRLAATAAELAWLGSFECIASLPKGPSDASGVPCTPAAEWELEYVREPPPEAASLVGRIGLSADRRALIFYGAQLHVIPVEDVLAFNVVRLLPAKGRGGSRLELECRTRCAGLTLKRLTLTEARGPEDLNALAAELSRRTARPFRLAEYEYDA